MDTRSTVSTRYELCRHLFGMPGPDSRRNISSFTSGLGPRSLAMLGNYGVSGACRGIGINSAFRFVHRNCFYISGSSARGGVIFGHAITLGSSFIGGTWTVAMRGVFSFLGDGFPASATYTFSGMNVLINGGGARIRGTVITLSYALPMVGRTIGGKYRLVVARRPMVFDKLGDILSSVVIFRTVGGGLDIVSVRAGLSRNSNNIGSYLTSVVNLRGIRGIATSSNFILQGNIMSPVSTSHFTDCLGLILNCPIGCINRGGVGAILIYNNTNTSCLRATRGGNYSTLIATSIGRRLFLRTTRGNVTLFSYKRFGARILMVGPLYGVLGLGFSRVGFVRGASSVVGATRWSTIFYFSNCAGFNSWVVAVVFHATVLFLFIAVTVHLVKGHRVNSVRPGRLIIALLLSRVTTVPLRSASRPVLGYMVTVFVLMVVRVIISIFSLGDASIEHLLGNRTIMVVGGNIVSRITVGHMELAVVSLVRRLEVGSMFSVSAITFTVLRIGNRLDILLGATRRATAIGSVNIGGSGTALPVPIVASKGVVDRGLATLRVARGSIRGVLGRGGIAAGRIFLLALSEGGGTGLVGVK